MLWKTGLSCGYRYVQVNAPGGNEPRRARSRRRHLPEAGRRNHRSESLASQAGAVGGIEVCGMVATSVEGAVALLRSGSC